MIENQIINKAINFIFSHIDEELSVERIADFCGYSDTDFSTMFRGYFEKSPAGMNSSVG